MAGAPPSAQPPVPPSLPVEAEPAALARALTPQVEAAIARQELHQIASLPTQAAPDEPPTARLSFEVPLMTPQGPAVAGFEIRREAPERDAEGGTTAAPVWRVSFALDLEPIGLVEAQVMLKGAKAGVTLWAERPASAERLAAGGEALMQALARASFEPELAVRAGRAPRPATAPGRFLDQAT
jgi:hypothetical protein